MKIYLAGPFFNEKQLATIELIETQLDKLGFDYFSPRKGGGKIEHLPLEQKKKESKRIYQSNIDAIMECNILLAVIDGRDTGTIFEMGYLRGAHDFANEFWKNGPWRYLVTYTDENYGLNIMIKEAVDAHLIGEHDLKAFTNLIKSHDWDPAEVFSHFQNFNPNVI